jgi:murein DD-endopeptidase MepM/ murein hydrolase activator NlpD
LTEVETVVSRIRNRLKSIEEAAKAHSRANPAAHPIAPVRRAWARLSRNDGLERLIPVGLCVLLAAAALVSTLPVVPPASAAPRLANVTAMNVTAAVAGATPDARYGSGDGPLAPDVNDLYLGDGSIPNSLQNPGVAMDAKTQLRTYAVQAGDTFNEISGQFGLAPSTLYWANKSKVQDPAALRVGQQLVVLPMDGLLVTIGAKDSLDSLVAKYKVTVQDIVDANNLPEATVVVGQTLIIPGASGGPIPRAKAPSVVSTTVVSSTVGSSTVGSSTVGSSTVGSTRSGSWFWPVGGHNYISQYFWSGHHAIDIAAGYGTAVVAAASGTVVKVGNNGYTGGGNVIWVMEGTKLYTTYNHLSSWGVRVGQRISAGQVIGRVGATGEATGPHLHFEVWLGYPWGLGTVSNAVNPCAYLAGC